MLKYLEKLCSFASPSGGEKEIIKYISNEISPYCECSVDALGNLIAFKKGAFRPVKRVQVDAHVDEVGIIVTEVNPDGSLCFSTVGGINCESLVSKRVMIKGHIGVVQTRPVHLLSTDEKEKMPDKKKLTVDIGAKDSSDALKYVKPGDLGTFASGFDQLSDRCIISRALDDRVGCAVMMQLITEQLDYDAWFTFSVQEEIGCRGAKADSYTVKPEIGIILEATTAADIVGMPPAKQVCRLSKGAAISFMDSGTLYDKKLYNAAFDIGKEMGIPVQPKAAPTGGNDASAVHLAGMGARVVAISTPCRYLHSSACVIDKNDADAVLKIAREMLRRASGGLL